MKRKEFINHSLLSILGSPLLISQNQKEPGRKRSLRVVHLTDMHIEQGEKIRKVIGKMVKQICDMEDQPDFILNTGDNIMDAMSRGKAGVNEQWQAWQEYFMKNVRHEMHSCIGNHDIWGWALNDTEISNDPLSGKSWASAMLNMPGLYYSFEKNGWKFICLDSSSYDPKGKGYTAKLDEEQFRWLEKEIENTPPETFICIATHIPILSVAVYFDGDNLNKGNWLIPGAWMHTDAKELKTLFHRHPNVKVALSGHIHMSDQVEFLGVRYLCNGSVCGKWWLGKYHEFGSVYAVVDFYDDGSVYCELKEINR